MPDTSNQSTRKPWKATEHLVALTKPFLEDSLWGDFAGTGVSQASERRHHCVESQPHHLLSEGERVTPLWVPPSL